MADPVSVRNFRDSFVNSAKPTRNYSSLSRLKLSGSTPTMYGYLFCSKPWPPGSKLGTVYLRVWNAEDWAGSVTLTVNRLTSNWSGSRVNWNNKPSVGGNNYSLTKTDAPKGTMWEIDITGLMQYIATGGKWYGLQLSVSGSTVRSIYSSQALLEYRPEMFVQWADPTDPPDNLSPAGNRAVDSAHPTFDYAFTDPSGDQDIAMQQIQISSDSTFAVVDWDSGWLTTEVSQFDTTKPNTNAVVWAGLADGASTYWRVRAQDGAGVQTDWSDPAQFKYVSRGTLTSGALAGPDANGKYYVTDTTPPIVWTFTGRTQAAYRAYIYDTANPKKILWDTHKVTGTATSVDTGGAKKTLLKSKGATYRLVIRVWDTVNREKTVDQHAIYYEYAQDFIYKAGTGVEAPANTSVSLQYPWPWVDVSFTRSTPADSFTVWRDGEVVEANIDTSELTINGTTYTYRDRGAAPRNEHTWTVTANVNGVDSAESPGATATPKPSVTWMMNPDSSSPICLLKSASEPTPVVDAQSQSMQEVHQPIGGAPPVLITQYISGFEGHVDAVLSDGVVNGLSAKTMRDRFKAWKRNPGTEVMIYMVDEVMTVVPYNMTYRPRAKSGGKIIYDVSFDFFQVDY